MNGYLTKITFQNYIGTLSPKTVFKNDRKSLTFPKIRFQNFWPSFMEPIESGILSYIISCFLSSLIKFAVSHIQV